MNIFQSENYLKGVLTVIAICLILLTLSALDLMPKAHANKGNNPYDRVTQNYGLVPVNSDGSITVRLSPHSEIDVNIADISTRDELNVNVSEIGGGFVSHGGPIPVEIDD
ncbi:MAG: hypothetical protein AAFV80_04895 [Bacteroidota bacterium]